jgi:polyhydroxybutyrate depolymerase
VHQGTVERTLSSGGERRSYLLHRPPVPAPGAPPPLVVVLHGATLTEEQTERYYHWDALADADGVAVAYPQGINDAWNAGSCCSDAPSRGTDDVAFLSAVLDDAVALVGADPARLYLTGVSNGAMMTLRYECERPGRLAAIGSVAGTFTSPCPSVPAVPFIEIHGLADTAVSFRASDTTVESGPDLRLPAVETIGRFLAADRCGAPTAVTAGPVHSETAACAPGLDVKVITVDGAGHQWPGATLDPARAERDGPANQPDTHVDATRELWSFFSAHRLGARG